MEDGGAGGDGGGAVHAADAGVVVSDSGEGESRGVRTELCTLRVFILPLIAASHSHKHTNFDAL
ncbi:hypothetical protein RJ639_009509 [Escallonia herrerae]|uniref:Uncharacterized protein n=1 Tax=Escallonia herrerae TaxID=1293975 RepID=A0AA88VV95_9ASTE|nr:hypothetical protein RJ639_009509 [Escallonia herrerae]